MHYLLVGTRKGAWIFTSEDRLKWACNGPHFLGSIIHHFVIDPRDGKTMLMAVSAGHLGPTIMRSTDFGVSWQESMHSPAFSKVENVALEKVENARSVDFTFWLEPGHRDEPNVWWAGTSPPGIFKSVDGGKKWENVEGWNENPMYEKWCPGEGTPGGELLAQIAITKDDPRHMYAVSSSGGLFESLDQCETWAPLNKGVEANFQAELFPVYGQDVHQFAIHPQNSNRMYQQNHCGIYRIDRPDDTWVRIGDNMPKEIGDIGFSMIVHPEDENSAWVFPMDGSDVWPRTSPGGKPATYHTKDGGESWIRQDSGFPQDQAWFTVKRQAFVRDDESALGLYIGTTVGEIWHSVNAGDTWQELTRHLPEIYSLHAFSID